MIRHDIALNSFADICSSYFSSTNTLHDSIMDEIDDLKFDDNADKLSIIDMDRYVNRKRMLKMRRNAIVTENYLQENEHRAAVMEGVEQAYLQELKVLREEDNDTDSEEILKMDQSEISLPKDKDFIKDDNMHFNENVSIEVENNIYKETGGDAKLYNGHHNYQYNEC